MIGAWLVLSAVAWTPETSVGFRCDLFVCGENGTEVTGLDRPVDAALTVTFPDEGEPVTTSANGEVCYDVWFVGVVCFPSGGDGDGCPDWGCGSNGTLEDGLARSAGEPATVTLADEADPDAANEAGQQCAWFPILGRVCIPTGGGGGGGCDAEICGNGNGTQETGLVRPVGPALGATLP